MFIVYLFNRFLERIWEFFRHWHIKSFFFYSHIVVSFLERLDGFFAFKITLRHLFKPLYGDYSVLGYILGFIFRIGRLIAGGLVYSAIIAAAAVLYLIWLTTPIYIIYRIFI